MSYFHSFGASMNSHELLGQLRVTPVDQMGVIDRIARIKSRSIKKEAKLSGLEKVLSMIDLTTLEGADTENKVRQLSYKAIHLHDV